MKLKNNMKKILKSFICVILFINIAYANENYFSQGKNLFEKKRYNESKFLFQRNLVFNPKDSNSYFYLAKIYEIEENQIELEKNLNTTLLLDPKNETAMYMLIELELKKSNFSKVKKLSDDFVKICSSLCDKKTSIKKRLEDFDTKDES